MTRDPAALERLIQQLREDCARDHYDHEMEIACCDPLAPQPESDWCSRCRAASALETLRAELDAVLESREHWIRCRNDVADACLKMQAERDAFRDEANALRRNYLRETKDLAGRADASEAKLAALIKKCKLNEVSHE